MPELGYLRARPLMRVLFDQDRPLPIKSHLPNHEVITAREIGWSTLLNGDLLRAAEDAGFEVFVTTDTHLADQQNSENHKLAIEPQPVESIEAKIDSVVSAVNNCYAEFLYDRRYLTCN